MNVQDLLKAVRMNGVTDIVFNKMDVLEQIGQWKFYNGMNLCSLIQNTKSKVGSPHTSHFPLLCPISIFQEIKIEFKKFPH